MWRRHHKTKFGGKFKSAFRKTQKSTTNWSKWA